MADVHKSGSTSYLRYDWSPRGVRHEVMISDPIRSPRFSVMAAVSIESFVETMTCAVSLSSTALDYALFNHALAPLWYHSQADPTRAAFPTGHPVVSSKTPDVSAKTHTHNWCGRHRQAANTTQRCEAQRLLASLGGFGTALLSRSDIPNCPLPSTLRGTLASRPKTGVKRGPHPPPGVCPRPNQNTQSKSPRRG